MKPFTFALRLLLVWLLTIFLAACAASTPNFSGDIESGAKFDQARQASAPAGSFPNDQGDLDALARLWQRRSQEKAALDYPVGPGDIVEISVPAIEELRAREVRIAGDGTISLPFIGKIKAAGLTEEELKEKVVEQLREYMYNPRVVVFVKEYHSRQAAVLGAVVKPGVYGLTAGADTLLDLISQAGGIAPGADPKIYLIPAEPVESGRATEVASILPTALLQQDPSPLILKRTEPILIDIKQLAFGGNQHYLSLKVRPGDVIMVPGGGQVLVEGWVEKPGAYGISPGLTVAGVVAAAGGPLYPADIQRVKVIRADKQGIKSFIVVDLDKIKRGGSADIALQGGDIVEVPAETSKLVSYGLYKFFTTIVNVGVGGNIPIIK